MKLFVVHCGFYDNALSEGEAPNIYEGHYNFYVAAEDASEAKAKVKEKTLFKSKKMHVDGIHHLNSVDGFKVNLIPAQTDKSSIQGYSYDKSKKL